MEGKTMMAIICEIAEYLGQQAKFEELEDRCREISKAMQFTPEQAAQLLAESHRIFEYQGE